LIYQPYHFDETVSKAPHHGGVRIHVPLGADLIWSSFVARSEFKEKPSMSEESSGGGKPNAIDIAWKIESGLR
jgi:hypothetical protein